jgi:hypothetical protein
MSCWEFSAGRQEKCLSRSASPSMPARCRHIYRRSPPQDGQCTMEALQSALQEYGCHHYRTPAQRHRRIPEEYEMPNPVPEAEDDREEETSGSEADEKSSTGPQFNFRRRIE